VVKKTEPGKKRSEYTEWVSTKYRESCNHGCRGGKALVDEGKGRGTEIDLEKATAVKFFEGQNVS